MDHPQAILERCTKLAGIGRVIEAEELAAQALGDHPDDGGLWQLRGRLRHLMGDTEAACAAFETAGLLIPLAPWARFALAESYVRLGHGELAGVVFHGLVADRRCPTELLPDVAAGLGALNDYGSALDACLELIRREPGHHQAHFGVAYYLRRLGRPVTAVISLVSRAHELAPEVPLYRLTLATMLDQIGRRDEAYDLVRDMDPRVVRCDGCLRRMMLIFQAAGDPRRSEACRAQARQINSPSESPHPTWGDPSH